MRSKALLAARVSRPARARRSHRLRATLAAVADSLFPRFVLGFDTMWRQHTVVTATVLWLILVHETAEPTP